LETHYTHRMENGKWEMKEAFSFLHLPFFLRK
jgi:hypothetical protein